MPVGGGGGGGTCYGIGIHFVWAKCEEGSSVAWVCTCGRMWVGARVGVCWWVGVHVYAFPHMYCTYTYMCAHVYECTYIHTYVEPYAKGKFTGPEHNTSVQSVPSHSVSLIQ